MMQRRQICERSVFDGSADDPRVLVHRYQQRMRADLLAKAALEVQREAWFSNLMSALVSSATGLVQAIISPAARPATAPARPAMQLIPSA